jgi:glutathione S-transferase
VELVLSKLQVLEEHMKGRKCFAGGTKTVADAHAFVYMYWVANEMKAIDKFPSRKSFYDLMSADRGAQETIAEQGTYEWDESPEGGFVLKG